MNPPKAVVWILLKNRTKHIYCVLNSEGCTKTEHSFSASLKTPTRFFIKKEKTNKQKTKNAD